MKCTYLLTIFFLFALNSCAQDKKQNQQPQASDIKVGGGCEGCEAIFESPISFNQLNNTDSLPDFNEKGPRLEITGTIYKPDGVTPAPGIILYVYHTNQEGKYEPSSNAQGWAKRHGYIRGWIKTGADGKYKLYTLVPASYPNSNNPKHIHPTIKEPGKTPYWINEYLFEDDPLLPEKEKNQTDAVGGNGVLKTVMKDGMLRATRDIILGKNVRDYR